MTDYVDLINKCLTWYKDVHIEVVNEEVYQLPILRVFDDWMKTQHDILYVSASDILRVFHIIGINRISYTNKVNR